jgi:hypothetical protein
VSKIVTAVTAAPITQNSNALVQSILKATATRLHSAECSLTSSQPSILPFGTRYVRADADTQSTRVDASGSEQTRLEAVGMMNSRACASKRQPAQSGPQEQRAAVPEEPGLEPCPSAIAPARAAPSAVARLPAV